MAITPLDMQAFNKATGHENKALDELVSNMVVKTSKVLEKTGVTSAAQSAAEAAKPLVQNVAQALEPAQQIVAGAKTIITDPLRYLSQAAAKAIPAAIAASASLQYTGGQGSFSNFLQPINLRTKFFGVNGYRNTYIGGALYATRVLNTLTGYCKCSDVKLDLPGTGTEPTATLEEQQIAVRYLESGFYIE